MTRPDRDAGELPLLAAALDADLPVLGVCRGMELLAVAYGGTLHQHLPDVVGHDGHRPAPGVYGGTHRPGSRRAAWPATVFGERAEVNSYHHQGVADPGTLTVTGWADDGVIEAVEDPARPFVLGVQWHPEAAGERRSSSPWWRRPAAPDAFGLRSARFPARVVDVPPVYRPDHLRRRGEVRAQRHVPAARSPTCRRCTTTAAARC